MKLKIVKTSIIFLLVSMMAVSGLFAADNMDQILDIVRSMDFDVYDPPVPAPDFTLPGLNGGSITLSEVNKDLIYLSVWTTWCSYCKKESPRKDKLWAALKDYEGGNGFEMICASVKEEKSTVQSYMNTNGYTFPVYLDSSGSVKDAYNVSGYPTSILIVDNKILGSHPGQVYWDTAEVQNKVKRIIDLVENPTPTPTATVPPTPSPTQAPVNIAFGKQAYASGEYSSEYPKTALNDGTEKTVWGSLYNAGDQWFYIDLEKEIDIDHVIIKFYNPYYATRYYIGYSNDATNWELPVTVNDGDGGVDQHYIRKTARYIGVLLADGPMNVYGISEFVVNYFPIIGSPTPDPTPQPTPTGTVPPVDPWQSGVDYKIGDRVYHDNAIWVCKNDHLSNAAWYPGAPGVYLWEKE